MIQGGGGVGRADYRWDRAAATTVAVPDLSDIVSVLEYPYARTTGPILGPFLTGLRDGRILGNRCGDRVLCPPLELDPDTGATLDPDFVEVGPGGEIVGWTWVADPSRKHPLREPFAFALIRLDGADTPLVHAVAAPSMGAVSTGARVVAQWHEERVGAITDLHFVLEGQQQPVEIEAGSEPVEITEHVISLTYTDPLHPHRRRFAEALLDGRIVGQRSPVSGKVTVPGKGYDPLDRVLLSEDDDVEVADVGTVVSYTVITPVQYHGQEETEPYIRCSILLDGADSPVQGIDVRDIPEELFRVGLRLRAVWKRREERSVAGLDNRGGSIPETVIDRWEPTGEPDVDPELLREHSW